MHEGGIASRSIPPPSTDQRPASGKVSPLVPVTSRLPRSCIPVILGALLILAGCTSGNDDPEPTPSDATVTPPPTLAPGQVAVGSIIDQAASAWPAIDSARITYVSGPTGTAIEQSPNRTIEEVIPPASRRVVTVTGGSVTDEQLIVDGRIFMRGSFVASAVAPGVSPAAWVTIDPTQVTDYTPVGQRVAYLTAPISAPFGSVSPETRALPATSAGSVQLDGRTCNVWTFGATSPDGIAYELAIDASGLPCRLTQTAGGYANITLYEINPPDVRILSPEVATPVSGTPEG